MTVETLQARSEHKTGRKPSNLKRAKTCPIDKTQMRRFQKEAAHFLYIPRRDARSCV